MKYLIIAMLILLSHPVLADDLSRQLQDTFDRAQIQEEIEYLRINQERRWREEDERREQEKADQELKESRKQIEREYQEVLDRLKRQRAGEYNSY